VILIKKNIKKFLKKIKAYEFVKKYYKKFLVTKVYFSYFIKSYILKKEDSALFFPYEYGKTIVNISPEQVNYGLKTAPRPKRYFIFSGNWDSKENIGYLWEEDYEKREVFKVAGYWSVKQLFIDEMHYKKTDQYKYMYKNLKEENYSRTYGCKNKDELDLYFKKLIKTYKTIKKDGYRSQKELMNDYPDMVKKKDDEIKVYLNRKGEFIQGRGGSHRLAIAKILELESVPVIICGIHYEYYKKLKNDYENKDDKKIIKNCIQNSIRKVDK